MISHRDTAFQPYPSRRSVVHSTNGIVACSQPLAAQAGIKILREGGNAAVSYGAQTVEADLLIWEYYYRMPRSLSVSVQSYTVYHSNIYLTSQQQLLALTSPSRLLPASVAMLFASSTMPRHAKSMASMLLAVLPLP